MAEPKKVVYGVEIYDDRCKKKAMKAISSLEGIQSIVMNMKDKKLTVAGVIDPVCGYKKLMKVCNTKILLVEPVKKKDFKHAENTWSKFNKPKADTSERAGYGEDSCNGLSFSGFCVLKAATCRHFSGDWTYLQSSIWTQVISMMH
ncbi:heavy metal-associated isoprenylated plant protein 39 [Artemisia annua]|uniref:Heavy metal-associated isoprenylated plant protein 39 n=1 Tax=Artemisia annua TaxID=35608 RepID=A0A2U1QE98_ARTAN|nr:heavy metal-associated isoprenylated plant protein 39 [Artemisia annua]